MILWSEPPREERTTLRYYDRPLHVFIRRCWQAFCLIAVLALVWLWIVAAICCLSP